MSIWTVFHNSFFHLQKTKTGAWNNLNAGIYLDPITNGVLIYNPLQCQVSFNWVVDKIRVLPTFASLN